MDEILDIIKNYVDENGGEYEFLNGNSSACQIVFNGKLILIQEQ